RSRTIQVPVEMPQGVSPKGIFGDKKGEMVQVTTPMMARSMQSTDAFVGGAFHGALSAPITRANESVDTKAANPLPEKKKDERRELEQKLHPGLLAVYECWVKGPNAKCGNVNQGRIAIQVWLSESSPSLMKELKALGFVVTPGKTGAQLRGTLPMERLRSLAGMKEVKLVALEKSSQ
ncbi:MAG: uncharacterized protein JWO20_1024, partial [Candidatus Angelobacter sp.]|nr:uncharacterized protein [Candidatus Angelobacter sp.]